MSGKKRKCYFSRRNIDGVRFFPVPQWTMDNLFMFQFLCHHRMCTVLSGNFLLIAREYLAILGEGNLKKRKKHTQKDHLVITETMGWDQKHCRGRATYRRQGKYTRMGSKHFHKH